MLLAVRYTVKWFFLEMHWKGHSPSRALWGMEGGVATNVRNSSSSPLRGEGWERVIKLMAKRFTHLAKNLRKRSTDVERLLWSRLRAGRFEGLKFRRQHPIGQYIADFVCLERKLIIELDGGQHALADEILKDRQRDAWLEKEGYTVVRFWDNDVLMNTSGVLDVIREKLYRTPSPQSPPLEGGEVITHTKRERACKKT
jgi:very-short-patch-repair endonuclease